MATQTLDKNGNVVQGGFSTNMTPDQFAQSSAFQTPSTSTNMPSSVNTNMSIGSISAAPKLQGSLAQTTLAPTDTSLVGSANVTGQSIIEQQQKAFEASKTNTQNDSAISEYRKLLGFDGSTSLAENKANDTSALNNQYGISATAGRIGEIAKETQANDLAAKARIQQIGANLGGITNSDNAGFQEQINRQTASKNLMLAAESLTLQGKFDSANTAIKNAIDTKYAGQEARLANLVKFLDLNKDAMGREGEKQKALAEAKAKDLQAVKDKETATETGINNIKAEISKNGGNPSLVDGAKTVGEALTKAGTSLATPQTEVIKMKQGDNEVAYLVDKRTGKIVKSFGTSSGSGYGAIGSKNPNAGVAETIIASGKFTKEQASSIRNAINNGEDPFTVIKNNVKNIMGQTEATKLTNAESVQSAMHDLKSSIQSYYDAGGDTNLFKGNLEKVTNKLGEVQDPRLAQLAVEVQSQLQSYRNAISGTAYSDQEGKDIASVFPGINKGKVLNDSIFAGRDKALNSQIDGLYKSALGEKTYNRLKENNNQANAPIALFKGNMDDKTFVEKALTKQGINYMDAVNKTPTGQIPVLLNKTGEQGYIPISEFNAGQYTKL